MKQIKVSIESHGAFLDLLQFVQVFPRDFVNFFTYLSIELKCCTYLFIELNRSLKQKVDVKNTEGISKFRMNGNQSSGFCYFLLRSKIVQNSSNCKKDIIRPKPF